MKVEELIRMKGYLPEECFAILDGKVLPDNAEISEDEAKKIKIFVFTVLG